MAFIAFCIEKAEDFISSNKNFTTRKTDWWWAVYPEVVDGDIFENVEDYIDSLRFYDRDGNELSEQPIYGYKLLK